MRACTLALSVIAHLLLLALVVVIPLFANDTLPDPHRTLEFVEVMPVSIPSPPPVLRSREQSSPETAPSTGAPFEEPQGFAPKSNPTIMEPFDVPASLVDGVVLDDDSLVRDPVPPPPRERDPVRVGGLITRPERVRYVPPVYPDVARAARIEGTVILEAVIGTDGAVREVRVLRPAPFLEARGHGGGPAMAVHADAAQWGACARGDDGHGDVHVALKERSRESGGRLFRHPPHPRTLATSHRRTHRRTVEPSHRRTVAEGDQ